MRLLSILLLALAGCATTTYLAPATDSFHFDPNKSYAIIQYKYVEDELTGHSFLFGDSDIHSHKIAIEKGANTEEGILFELPAGKTFRLFEIGNDTGRRFVFKEDLPSFVTAPGKIHHLGFVSINMGLRDGHYKSLDISNAEKIRLLQKAEKKYHLKSSDVIDAYNHKPMPNVN